MDNFACLVIQYPSGFCVVDTTAPLQSPICVLINCDVTMNNVSRWQIILMISNVLKVICEFILSDCPPFLCSYMNFHLNFLSFYTFKVIVRYGSVQYSTVRLIIPLLYFSYMNIFDFLFSQSFAIDISNGMRT